MPWMKDEEICKLYKNAKNQKEQVKILAELNGCSIDTIERILKSAGYEPELPPQPKKRGRHKDWSVKEFVQLLRLADSGLSFRKIAKKLERSESAVSNAYSKMHGFNYRPTEKMREALRIFNNENRSVSK